MKVTTIRFHMGAFIRNAKRHTAFFVCIEIALSQNFHIFQHLIATLLFFFRLYQRRFNKFDCALRLTTYKRLQAKRHTLLHFVDSSGI